MNDPQSTLLRRLEDEEDLLAKRALTYLADDQTRLIGGRSTKVNASETLRLWSTRFGNEDLTGQQLEGAERLLARLRGLPGNKKLEQFAFVSPEVGGNLFFEATGSRRLLGTILFRLPRRATAA